MRDPNRATEDTARRPQIASRLLWWSSYGVGAAVDVKDFAGRRAAQVGEEEKGRVGDLGGVVGIPAERGGVAPKGLEV